MTARSTRSPALIAVSDSLRNARLSRKTSLRTLAKKLGISPQILSLVENGLRAPSTDLAAHILGYLQVAPADYKQIMKFVRLTDLDDLIEELDSATEPLLWAYERISHRMFEWSPKELPDLLQSSTYTRTALTGGPLDQDMVEVELFQRQVRQDAMDPGLIKRYAFFLSEDSLQRQAEHRPLTQDQLEHISAQMKRFFIDLRVVPADVISADSIPGFTIFEGEDRNTAVLRHHHTNLYLTSDPLVERYRKTMSTLAKNALSVADSLNLLRSLCQSQLSQGN